MTSKSKKILIISGAAFLALILAAVLLVYAPTKIRRGVHAAGVDLGGMTVNQAEDALKDAIGKYPNGGTINLDLASNKRSIDTSDFDVSYSNADTAKKAYLYGREGNIFKRIGAVFTSLIKDVNVPMEFAYDSHKLSEKISELMVGTGTPVEEYSYEIRDSKFFITNGKKGDMPDSEAVVKEVLSACGKYDFNTTLAFEKETRFPKDVNVDELYEKVHIEPADAYYELSGKEVYVVPAVYGVDFDKKEAERIIKSHEEYGETYEIPADIHAPAVLTEDAEAKLFTKTLASYKTNFNSGDVSRSSNIALAAKMINNTVLMPGDLFSYNTTVGERTEAAGFKIAHVYMNNEVVDGIGGGICQVSSTLYCAVLYANLDVVERVNHQLPVSYVPLGQDATVDYGNIDFKFKNSTLYPLKINAYVSGGTITVELSGYKDTDEKVEIIPVITAVIEPKIVEEKDPLLPLGETKEKEKGSTGSVVETYKRVTANGVTSDRVLVSRSTYAAGKTIMLVGTGEPELKPEMPENLTQTPESTAPAHETQTQPQQVEEIVITDQGV